MQQFQTINIELPSVALVLSEMPAAPLSRLEFVTGGNSDIIEMMRRQYEPARRQLARCSNLFRQSDPAACGAAVFQFLKTNVRFEPDSNLNQVIKLPKGLLMAGVGDCKSFTLFCCAVLSLMGFDVAMVFCSSRKDEMPTHVFCAYGFIDVKNPKNSVLLNCDPTISGFNEIANGFTSLKTHVFINKIQK